MVMPQYAQKAHQLNMLNKMIIIITGGIGSGKSLTAIKEIVDRKQMTFTNFKLNKIKDCPVSSIRLKYEHIFKTDIQYGPRGKKTVETGVNYAYWQQAKKRYNGFDIVLDEFHNVMNARRSMSKRNTALSDWLAQIRKVLGDSEQHNLYLITQKLRRIDVNSRDLAHACIKCEKVVYKNQLVPTPVCYKNRLTVRKLPLVVIYKHYFESADALNAYELAGIKHGYKGTTRFIANNYYKYYNSYEMVDFGNDEYV